MNPNHVVVLTLIHIYDLKLAVTSVAVHVQASAFHFSKERKSPKRKEEIGKQYVSENQLATTFRRFSDCPFFILNMKVYKLIF